MIPLIASCLFVLGGDGGDRTPGLYIANVPLSHLSYIPTLFKGFKDSRSHSRHRRDLNQPILFFCRKPHVPKGRTKHKNLVSQNGPAPGGEPLLETGIRHPKGCLLSVQHIGFQMEASWGARRSRADRTADRTE